MEDHRVVAVGVDQPVFCPAAEPGDLGAGQPLSKVLGEGPAQVAPARVDPRDPPAFEDARQAANGGFDFGKLGQGGRMAEGARAR